MLLNCFPYINNLWLYLFVIVFPTKFNQIAAAYWMAEKEEN